MRYRSGRVDNFFGPTVFEPFARGITSFVVTSLDGCPALKHAYHGGREGETPFQRKTLLLLRHIHGERPPSFQQREVNRRYYSTMIFLLREVLRHLPAPSGDTLTRECLAFIDSFLAAKMERISSYRSGLEFLEQKMPPSKRHLLDLDCDIGIVARLCDVWEGVNDRCQHSGTVTGLYDPLLLGNPTFSYYTCALASGTSLTNVRLPCVVSDRRQGERGELVDGCIAEEFQRYLVGKRYLYINLMKRQVPDVSESFRSACIEHHHREQPTFLPCSLACNSSLFHQRRQFRRASSVAQFRRRFLRHVTGETFHVSIASLHRKWREICEGLFNTVHRHFFDAKDVLTRDERKVFVVLFYCLLIDELLTRGQSEYFSLVCKDNMDRGGMMNALFYVYLLLKNQRELTPHQSLDLVFLIFVPALLVSNRAIRETYFWRLREALQLLLRKSIPPGGLQVQAVTMKRDNG